MIGKLTNQVFRIPVKSPPAFPSKAVPGLTTRSTGYKTTNQLSDWGGHQLPAPSAPMVPILSHLNETAHVHFLKRCQHGLKTHDDAWRRNHSLIRSDGEHKIHGYLQSLVVHVSMYTARTEHIICILCTIFYYVCKISYDTSI